MRPMVNQNVVTMQGDGLVLRYDQSRRLAPPVLLRGFGLWFMLARTRPSSRIVVDVDFAMMFAQVRIVLLLSK